MLDGWKEVLPPLKGSPGSARVAYKQRVLNLWHANGRTTRATLLRAILPSHYIGQSDKRFRNMPNRQLARSAQLCVASLPRAPRSAPCAIASAATGQDR